MSSVLEYTYDDESQPLSDKEAMDEYARAKATHRDALVTLDRLSCGEHWRVNVYRTKIEKEKFLRKAIENILERFAGFK